MGKCSVEKIKVELDINEAVILTGLLGSTSGGALLNLYFKLNKALGHENELHADEIANRIEELLGTAVPLTKAVRDIAGNEYVK